ncbi:MAG: DUF1499 domain-containing protein [Pseudomonas sp.]|uniref:DUF1499 domain-containing protein n=1 Tax=Pseudomonas sp. TaxID=306 RepID=UPI0033947838
MSPVPVGQTALIRGARDAHKFFLGAALTLWLTACGSSPAAPLGVRNGQLAPCPASPNCVNSQAVDSKHRVAALALGGSPDDTRELLLQVLRDEPGAVVVEQQATYLRVEYTSRLLRFVDDLELLIGPRQVEVRSASRLGYGDFGVNRARVEQLRQRLADAGPKAP